MWTVCVTCSLCSARTSNHRHDDAKVAGAAAEQEAIAAGFLPLPEIKREGRRRFEGFICGECRADVIALAP